jgi:tRNA(Ile2) C34 agmatinyltransferase TiaS
MLGQDWYDKEHGYTPETRPKCPVCGNELKFNGYNNGYQTACSLSCAAKLTQKRLKEHKFDKQLQYDKERGYTPETRPKCKQWRWKLRTQKIRKEKEL